MPPTRNFFYYDRLRYENILDDPSSRGGSMFMNIISTLLLVFICVLILESLGQHPPVFEQVFFIFDGVISSVFLLEYLYRFLRAREKMSFLTSPIRIIDFLSFAPFFLGLFAVGDTLKVLRILRVLRMLRLVKRIPLTAGFIKALKDYIDEYKAVFLLFFVILFIGSFFVYHFEHTVIDTKFTSIPLTLWWGLVTMTTVGYGDMVPLSNGGRIMWSILVFVWPLVLALVSAVTIMVFSETSRNHAMSNLNRRTRQCSRCTERNPKTANYCMVCGKKMNIGNKDIN